MKSEDEIAYERLFPTLAESINGGHIESLRFDREFQPCDLEPMRSIRFTGIIHVTINGETKRASEWLEELENGLTSPEFRAELAKYIGPEDMPQ